VPPSYDFYVKTALKRAYTIFKPEKGALQNKKFLQRPQSVEKGKRKRKMAKGREFSAGITKRMW